MILLVVVSRWLILAVSAAVFAGLGTPDAPAEEPDAWDATKSLSAVTATLKEIIGDATVTTCWIIPDMGSGKDDRAVPWVTYILKMPDGKRRELRIGVPLDSEAEARVKFRSTSMIAQIGAKEREDGDGYEMACWYSEALGGHGSVLFRRGTTVADVGGDLPLEVIKRQVAALDRLLQAGELPRQITAAAHVEEARLYALAHPPPTPTPTPIVHRKPPPGEHVFLQGDPAIIPFLRKILESPATGPRTDEASADATTRRDAVKNLADLAEPSTLPLLRRLAADEHEYPTVRKLAEEAAHKIETRK